MRKTFGRIKVVLVLGAIAVGAAMFLGYVRGSADISLTSKGKKAINQGIHQVEKKLEVK